MKEAVEEAVRAQVGVGSSGAEGSSDLTTAHLRGGTGKHQVQCHQLNLIPTPRPHPHGSPVSSSPDSVPLRTLREQRGAVLGQLSQQAVLGTPG